MKRKKSIIAAIAIAIMCLMPLFSMAQILKLDGVATERQTGDGTGGWGAAPGVDPGTGEYAPLGSGLWVLAASAGLYLLVKSKKKRRTKTVMLAALALTLGTTQCHKPTETESVNENGNEPQERTIYISLTSRNAYNPKTDLNLYDGKITWNNGDEVYVVYDGKLLSEQPLTVTRNPDNFQWGSINGKISFTDEIGEEPDFTFYYVGSGVDFTPEAGAESLTFDIANQKKSDCDVGEYMIGRTGKIAMTVKDDKYVPEEPNSVTFKPITSVLWLNTSSFGTGDMQLVGANAFNAMTINLGSPDNLIGTHSANISFTSSESVAVSVMPATAANAPDGVREKIVLAFNGNDKWGSLDMNYGIKPGIEYALINGALRSPLKINAGIEGALPGLFSVSAEEQVYFSKGNLQYRAKGGDNGDASKNADPDENVGGTWRFAENQYNYCGSYNTSPKYTSTNWIDLFCFGTSGYNHNNKSYMPWSCSSTASEFYAYDGKYNNLDASTGMADWGYNKILNGGKTEHFGWRVLTATEADYLFTKRTDHEKLYGAATVCGVHGLIILPDGWTASQACPFNSGFASASGSGWGTNSYDDTSWPKMQASGAVFLPAAGYRENDPYEYNDDDNGDYWTSTQDAANNPKYAYVVEFGDDFVTPNKDRNRSRGYSVRLVIEKTN